MANIGHFTDRNPNVRAAGITTVFKDGDNTVGCLKIANVEEKAEHLIRHECRRRSRESVPLLFKGTPFIPKSNVRDLLSPDLAKSRFVKFKEKFSEDMYFKTATVGQVQPAYSKPDSVTNWNRTFGKESESTDPAYPIIFPPKSAEQVNREYATFHDKYVLSHNHYFPAEHINRKYKQPFNRHDTFGDAYFVDDNGFMMRRCLNQCSQLTIISKTQMDFIDRTYARLGQKYKKYPYEVPTNMVHGIPSRMSDCDGKMLIENISPCVNNDRLVEAFGHLNKWRHKLQKMSAFHMNDLISVLESSDKERTGFLPLSKIFDIMFKMNLRVDPNKMRTCVAHFKMIVDEGCATERLNYVDFCHLLSIQLPLPTTGNISTGPEYVDNKDTIYRLLCADLKKQPHQGLPLKKNDAQCDDDATTVKDLVTPEAHTRLGLGISEYERLRPREQMERIFQRFVDNDVFKIVWEELSEQHKQQNEQFSVLQFRAVMDELKVRKNKF